MKKYGLTGLAGAGKDTAGAIISKMVETECAAIATPMKLLVHTLFSVTPEDAEDRVLKEAVIVQNITHEALQDTADLYYKLGLEAYMDFPEAWDQWYKLLDIQLPVEDSGTLTVNKSLRQLYQAIGTGWGRTTDADIWIKLFPVGKIATDVREENEATYLIKNGYDILRIMNDRVVPVNTHSSENGLPDHLVMINVPNHGELIDLHWELESIVKNDLR